MKPVLTKDEKRLIDGLMIFRVPTEQLTGIMLMLETEEQQRKMMLWMASHEKASVPELINKAAEISEE